MIEIPQGQSKFLVALIIVLTAVLIGVLVYLYLNGGLKLSTSQPTPVDQTPPESKLVDTSRIENCTAQVGTDPLVTVSQEVAPSVMELDFRGKVAETSQSGSKTSVKLVSLDGLQSYQFEIDNSEPVYGKKKVTLKDLKYLDELLIAVNCKSGEVGTFKYSKVYRIEK